MQPLVGVLGIEQLLHQLGLEREPVGQRQLAALVHAALDRRDRQRGAGGELVGVLPDLRLGALGVVHGRHQPHLARVLRGVGAAREQQLHRPARADQASEPLSSAVAGEQPERDFRQPQPVRAARREADVTGERDFETAAERVAG